jgi:acetolactate synthase I/II/III large subunit
MNKTVNEALAPPTTHEMSGADAVVDALLKHGLKSLYCLPGIQNDALFVSLFDRRNEIQAVHTRHEQGAAYMALGAALATGKPAAYAVVPGPGVLNTAAALGTAYSAGAKVLCLSGQIPSHAIGKGLGYLHELPDQLGILERLTKWAKRTRAPEDVPADFAEAFAAVRSGRPRPVAIEVPMDVLSRRAEIKAAFVREPDVAPALDDDALARAASLLSRAERPLIFVGGGAQDAGLPLRQLAEKLGAPVVAHRMGKGVLDDRHPLSLNLTAGHALWKGCDVVLAIGTRMHLPLTQWGSDAELRVIKVDVDRPEMSRGRQPDVALCGDALDILQRLNDQIRRPVGDRDNRVASSRALKAEIASKLDLLRPQLDYLRAIRDVLPDNGILVDESTQVGYVSRIGYETRLPRTYLSSGHAGTLGWGFPTALGAQHALPDTPVVSFTGDGGFMFNVQELATAAHHNIPLVTVLFNDGAFGNVQRMQRELYGQRVIATDLTNPDFVRMADSFGIDAVRAEGPQALRGVLARAIEARRPSLIEVPCRQMPEPWPFLQLPRVRGRS